jgi:hypothetical protein
MYSIVFGRRSRGRHPWQPPPCQSRLRAYYELDSPLCRSSYTHGRAQRRAYHSRCTYLLCFYSDLFNMLNHIILGRGRCPITLAQNLGLAEQRQEDNRPCPASFDTYSTRQPTASCLSSSCLLEFIPPGYRLRRRFRHTIPPLGPIPCIRRLPYRPP